VPNVITSPAATATEDHMATGVPLTAGRRSAPVTAITESRSTRSSGPRRVISNPAAPGSSPTRTWSPTGLPTSRFASLSA
jgi:hypothetical protein